MSFRFVDSFALIVFLVAFKKNKEIHDQVKIM